MPKNYQKITLNGVKKSFKIFFLKNFPEKTFREKLSGQTFLKNFTEKPSGKNFPEKNILKKLSKKKIPGKTFRFNLPTLFIRKKIWKAFPKNFPKYFYIASPKNFPENFPKKLYRKTFHPKFQDKLALKLPWKTFLEKLSRFPCQTFTDTGGQVVRVLSNL